MASLFLVRGCLCLPKLCALKVMLHERPEEYQGSVLEQVLGHFEQQSMYSSMDHGYITLRKAGQSDS